MPAIRIEEELNGHKYSVVTTSYADTIHILVHKDERIARVFRCQLYPQPGGVLSQDELVAGITPESLIGGRGEDISGHLYTEMIGSLILKQNPEERRMLVLGIGNIGPSSDGAITKEHRGELLFIMKMVQETSSAWSQL